MNPALVELIAEAIVEAVKLAEGKFTKDDAMAVIKKAERAASDAEMLKLFPGQAP